MAFKPRHCKVAMPLFNKAWLTITAVLMLFVFFGLYVYFEKQIDRANEQRQKSYQLTDLLLQTCTDLTRMARTYVVTGEPRYQQYFQDILDIRDGKKPRPEDYNPAYWDTVLANVKTPAPGEGPAIALLELVRRFGFTNQELGELSLAKTNSDALTVLEMAAMKLAQTGGANAQANRAKALLMLHDANYHQIKLKIIAPINAVYLSMDNRTLAAVHNMEKIALLCRLLFITAALSVTFMLWRSYLALRTTLGASVEEVQAHMQRIGRGHFSAAATVTPDIENSVLGGLFKMQNALYQHDIEYKHILQLLKDSEIFQHTIFDATPDAMLISNEQGIITLANKQSERLLGYSLEQLLGQSIDSLMPKRFRAAHPKLRAQYAAAPVIRSMGRGRAVMAQRQDGSEVDVEISLSPIQTAQGLFFASTLCDITERKHAEALLKASEAHFRRMADCSPMMIWITDAAGEPTFVNRTWFDFTGLNPLQTMSYADWIGTIHPDDRETAFVAYYQNPKANVTITTEYRLSNANGDWRWILDKGVPLFDENNTFTGYMGSAIDITERKAAEEQIKQLAFYDPLTQLPNRRLLLERLKHGINLERRDGRQLALLMLDLDRFKAVNDILGHAAGDELLQQVAARITQRLRDVDIVARLGGDEFIVLLEDLMQPEDAGRVAEDIINDLSKPFCLCQSDNIQIGVSIGISLYPEHGVSPETLMDHADTALYKAKDAGRGCFAYFSKEMTALVRERIELENRLAEAVKQQELRIFYQPQVDVASGRITGAEAVVGWLDAAGEPILDADLTAIAEETILVMEIGAWALRETCRQGKAWLDSGLPPLTLAVKIASQQFCRGELCALVSKVLSETGFPAQQLELEVTENSLIENHHHAACILDNLSAQGVAIAIDAFGSGYSSLGEFKHIQLNRLKIDRGFIDGIPAHKDNRAITAAIIAMGHILGFKVLADGVDTPDQLAFLQQCQCDSYQGLIKSRALPANEFAQLVGGEP